MQGRRIVIVFSSGLVSESLLRTYTMLFCSPIDQIDANRWSFLGRSKA